MRSIFALALLAAVGCGPADVPDGTDTDTDTDTDDGAACSVLPSGTYDASGSCFGMNMTVTLTMDAASCSFALDDWSMNHGDAPDGGTVDGDQVVLSGPGFDGCAGTVDGSDVSGVCDGGCAWDLGAAR